MLLQAIQNNTAIVFTTHHSFRDILYLLQPFYTINVQLQPDIDFIGLRNIQVCLGQMQLNANTVSETGGRGQGWHMKSSAWPHSLNMKYGCPNHDIQTEDFRGYFNST